MYLVLFSTNYNIAYDNKNIFTIYILKNGNLKITIFGVVVLLLHFIKNKKYIYQIIIINIYIYKLNFI